MAKTLSSLKKKVAGAWIYRLLVVPMFFTQQVLSFWFPKFLTLGLKLFDVLSLANTCQAFRV